MTALAGDWRGRGNAIAPGDKVQEAVACKLTFAHDTSNRISTTGKCATAAGSSTIQGWLECGTDLRATGPIVYPFQDLTIDWAEGKSRDGWTRIDVTARDRTNEDRIEFTTAVSHPADNAFQLIVTVKDGSAAGYDALRIDFTRTSVD